MKKSYYKNISLILFVLFVLSVMGKSGMPPDNATYGTGAILADILYYGGMPILIAFLFWKGDRDES